MRLKQALRSTALCAVPTVAGAFAVVRRRTAPPKLSPATEGPKPPPLARRVCAAVERGQQPPRAAARGGDDGSDDGGDDDPLDLLPPVVNWQRRSLLFDESVGSDVFCNDDVSARADMTPAGEMMRRVSGAADAAALAVWRRARSSLPGIVTGFRKDESVEDNVVDGGAAAGRLYNMLFVRSPTIAAGLGYAYNLFGGHPLVVDVGGGPFEVPPVIVLAALWAILRF